MITSRGRNLLTLSGYVDDFIKASPACKRAVLESVEALRAAGHECIEISVPEREFWVFGLSSGS